MNNEKCWKRLKRPNYSKRTIHSLYFKYRQSLSSAGRAEIDVGREGNEKTINDLVKLGIID